MLEDNTSADVQVLFDFLDNELDYAPFVSEHCKTIGITFCWYLYRVIHGE